MEHLKLLNEALKDLEGLRRSKKFKRVSELTIDNLRGEERQGEYNEIFEVYSLGVDDLHIKLHIITDSYGDGEAVNGIQIVKPIVKTVTDFETI